MGGDGHGIEPATARYDHRRAAGTFLRWLERWGLNVVPEVMVPPMDTEELRKARREAERVAEDAGRRDEVYALADVLDDHVATTLIARFDVWLGGPLLNSGQGTV